MTLTGAIVLLVIAGACGSLGSALAGYSHLGCLSSIVLGFVGAWLGAWIAHQLHLPQLFVLRVQNEDFPVVWSIVGATLFAAVVSLVMRPNRF